jgi:hypothetical protein
MDREGSVAETSGSPNSDGHLSTSGQSNYIVQRLTQILSHQPQTNSLSSTDSDAIATRLRDVLRSYVSSNDNILHGQGNNTGRSSRRDHKDVVSKRISNRHSGHGSKRSAPTYIASDSNPTLSSPSTDDDNDQTDQYVPTSPDVVSVDMDDNSITEMGKHL